MFPDSSLQIISYACVKYGISVIGSYIYPSYSGPDLIGSGLDGYILKKSGANLSFCSIHIPGLNHLKQFYAEAGFLATLRLLSG